MKLDPAVIELLKLDPEKTSVSSAGGGGCSSASTSKISTTLGDGGEMMYFMKTGKGEDARVMFEGEHASLAAIHAAVPNLCPNSFGHGQFSENPSTSYLVTDFLDLSSRLSSSSTSTSTKSKSKSSIPPPSLAAKLARLHTTPAPTPPGHKSPQFGFPVPTCCGDTPQDNTYNPSWSSFYANSRLRFIGRRCSPDDAELAELIETTASKVVPRLLGDRHLNHGKGVTPVVIHGDLWSGNASRGCIAGQTEPQDVVYDSSACYAHSEYELGIMRMFGGFGAAFLKEYHGLVPKTEPAEEYDDRIALYELYHHLNHYALFGGGYRGGAVGIMRRLVGKYGKGEAEL
ncbi:Ketosamine-3-kinase [Aulographum hederae CBS 113979]|uniref:protein-ribulosamine 3-kinase n=1 Tax=Aulographum hederae CBS 113979 TaxID=1176131 RepID=A0A6G1GSX5_9PEZI|nr:Ketosamine-3-kinase [Aulographum hederae CBS 113979]